MKRRNFLKLIPSLAAFSNIDALGNIGLSNDLLEKLAYLDDNENVLVIIQLKGGNDGLNTIIPLENYGDYSAARQNIAIKESKVLKINNNNKVGLNPNLDKINQLYNEGKLGIIQNVGYPNPNFSHFRSTDIWQSASNYDSYVNSGWIGRFLDYAFPNYPIDYPNSEMNDPLAINIGYTADLISQGPVQNMAMAITDAEEFYNLVNGNTGVAPNTNAGKELSFIRLIASQTNHYGSRIVEAASKSASQITYPDTDLANDLKIVAKLISGGIKTRIFMVSIGGFDTHSNQVDFNDTSKGEHATLLNELSEAIWYFQQDLEQLKISHKVLGITYSEFGRRIVSNASKGSDHGSAGPMFLFGDKVKSQILGNIPNLKNVDVESNIPYEYDFRSIYTSIIEQWFCIDFATSKSFFPANTNTVLQSIPIIYSSNCDVFPKLLSDTESNISVAPNPFVDNILIQFQSNGNNIVVQLIDNSGKLIEVLANGYYEKGVFNIPYSGNFLSAGMYYIRFQNDFTIESKSIIKVKA